MNSFSLLPRVANGIPWNRSLASKVTVVLLYAAIYLKDVASAHVGPKPVAALILLSLLVGAGVILAKGSWFAGGTFPVTLTCLGLGGWLSGALMAGAWSLSAYYLAIPCAFIIVNTDPKLFLKLLVLHFVLNLAIEGFEYFSGSYLYIYEAQDGFVLDERLFGGSLDVFRAKGFFQGPLSAVAFALWVAFLAMGELWTVAALLLTAFFSGGRLGMSVAVLLGLVRYWRLRGGHQISALSARWIKAAVGLAFVGGVALLFLFADENRLLFISSAYDVGSDQNAARLFYWVSSLAHFLSYAPMEMVFGRFGFILKEQGGTENDFLRILLDHGFICLLPYLLVVGRIFQLAIRRKNLELLAVGLLIMMLMNAFPFIQSLASTTLFWLFVFLLPYLGGEEGGSSWMPGLGARAVT